MQTKEKFMGRHFGIRCIIVHFRVHLSLHFKARLSAKSVMKISFHIKIGTNYVNKKFALRLALKTALCKANSARHIL